MMYVSWPPAWRRKTKLAFPASILGIRLIAPGVVGTIRSLFTNLGNDNSVSGRTEDYAIVLRVFGDNPVFGRGLTTFVPRYYRILDNQILMFLLELGVVGTVIFLGLAAVAFSCARGARLRSQVPERRHLAMTMSASIAGLLVSYATFDAVQLPDGGWVDLRPVRLGRRRLADRSPEQRSVDLHRWFPHHPFGSPVMNVEHENVAVVVVTYNSASVIAGLLASLDAGFYGCPTTWSLWTTPRVTVWWSLSASLLPMHSWSRPVATPATREVSTPGSPLAGPHTAIMVLNPDVRDCTAAAWRRCWRRCAGRTPVSPCPACPTGTANSSHPSVGSRRCCGCWPLPCSEPATPDASAHWGRSHPADRYEASAVVDWAEGRRC